MSGTELPCRPDQSTQRQSQPSCGRILVLITEDWFAHSHFRPLLAELCTLSRDVVLATRSSGRMADLQALGVRTIDFDFQRSSLNPLKLLGAVRQLAQLIGSERPDVVHAVAMQTMIMASAALRLSPPVPHTVLHLTGLGFLGISPTPAARLLRSQVFRLLGSTLRRPGNWLLAENPEDVAYLRERGADAGGRTTVLGGAGIDEVEFPSLPMPDNKIPVAAFVGRMIRAKGVEVLVEAQQRLARRGIPLKVALYGKSDDDASTGGLPRALLEAWGRTGDITWHGHVSNISDVWANSDIAVLPAITREGLPRSLLEAAASARPLVVTDVPGCRHLVRPGIDGLIVPPGNAEALADALASLAANRQLRRSMGTAARERVLAGFTTGKVREGIREAYRTLFKAQITN